MSGNHQAQSTLYDKTLGCLLGGIIGDAVGTPTEGLSYQEIESRFGWVEDLASDGTDDTVMKNLLSRALVQTKGHATLDDWAAVLLEDWQAIFGSKMAKFFMSVLHTAHKLKRHSLPREAALGNMPSSSSAMCISPVGIVNACDPRAAALQTYNLASLIHVQDVGFCQDGAVALAAATAAAFLPGASVDSIIQASTAYILPQSGRQMLDRIAAALDLAGKTGEYRAFREAVYADRERFFCRIACDSRETVPLTLALFKLAEGDFAKCITYGANFGRDADTNASMAGALAGAYLGTAGVPAAWTEKLKEYSSTDQADLARKLVETAVAKYESASKSRQAFAEIAALAVPTA